MGPSELNFQVGLVLSKERFLEPGCSSELGEPRPGDYRRDTRHVDNNTLILCPMNGAKYNNIGASNCNSCLRRSLAYVSWVDFLTTIG